MNSVEVAPECAVFTVFGEADPALLPRIVALFAKCALVPAWLHAEVLDGEMQVEVEFSGLSPAKADHFAEVLRQMPVVSLVRLRGESR